jgi:hypothetical protein
MHTLGPPSLSASKAELAAAVAEQAKHGANVLRVFAHGEGPGMDNVWKGNPIQPEPGAYNEGALQKLDYLVAEGGRQGLRFILPFTNYEVCCTATCSSATMIRVLVQELCLQACMCLWVYLHGRRT